MENGGEIPPYSEEHRHVDGKEYDTFESLMDAIGS